MSIPNVIGLTERAAINKLNQADFGHNCTYKEDNRGARGVVTAQIPAAGEKARQGAVIQLTVSTGGSGSASTGITVPNVVGQYDADARSQLEGLGLNVTDVTSSPYQRGRKMRNRVLFQNPAAGSTLQYGQTVTIYINRRN